MKNIIVYISPTGSFINPIHNVVARESEQLAKVQVENSIQLDWKIEDIILVTNFPWKYGLFNATVLENIKFNKKLPQANKINAVLELYNKDLIEDNITYWLHDLDAFQLEPISKATIRIAKADIAIAESNEKSRFEAGSVFFKKSAFDIFEKIKDIIDKEKTDEGKALFKLSKRKNIKKRIKFLDRTYNFTPFDLKSSYNKVQKPIKVAHFHPLGGIPELGVEWALKYYLGKNEISTPLITKRLVNILKYHRIG